MGVSHDRYSGTERVRPAISKAQSTQSGLIAQETVPKGPVQTAIQARYKALGGSAGFLGAPVGVESKTSDGKGRFCHFEGGSIYSSQVTGAHEVHGAIRDLWAAMGWENSHLRYPVTDELQTPNGVGRFSNFEGGQIAWSTQMGAAVSALFMAGPDNLNDFPNSAPQSAGDGNGSSPQVRRRLSCSASIHVVDDEDFGDNESGSDDAAGEVVLTNAVPQAIFEGMEAKAGGEVRVELELTAQAIDNGDIKVKGKATLFEVLVRRQRRLTVPRRSSSLSRGILSCLRQLSSTTQTRAATKVPLR